MVVVQHFDDVLGWVSKMDPRQLCGKVCLLKMKTTHYLVSTICHVCSPRLRPAAAAAAVNAYSDAIVMLMSTAYKAQSVRLVYRRKWAIGINPWPAGAKAIATSPLGGRG